MKNSIYYYITISRSVLILLVIFIFRCTEENTTEPPDVNLLLNTSFEKDGQPSSDGWSLPSGSKFVTDVPSGGGKYSLEIQSAWPIETYARIMVPARENFSNYKLTVWSKHSGIEGRVILSLVRNGLVIKSMNVTVTDIVWRIYSIQDTFSVASGDSFRVQLTAGVSQLLPGKTYFDLCKLQAVN